MQISKSLKLTYESGKLSKETGGETSGGRNPVLEIS